MLECFTYVPAMVCAAELVLLEREVDAMGEVQCRVRDSLGHIGGFVFVDKAVLAPLLALVPVRDGKEVTAA